MKFKLEINTDNAAFSPVVGNELARILRKIAVQIEECRNEFEDGRCLDYNGNRVGTFELMEE